MPDYADAGHRPHAIHTGETPRNLWDRGPFGITVTLDTWGPQENLFTTMYDALQSNWGDTPSRSVEQPVRLTHNILDVKTGWARLTDQQQAYVDSCFAGKTLPQVRELITFEFTVDGVSRAFTHQNVRTRLGAGFMQHGGRDNDWRHRKWTMPETIYRACKADDRFNTEGSGQLGTNELGDGTRHCITDWEPIEQFLADWAGFAGVGRLEDAIRFYLERGRELYSALVDAGIPWQDARRVLWMGTQTYIHDIYNYEAIQGMLARRLEHVMDWEINAVAQLMVREIRMKCHPLLSKYLMSLSDKLGKAAFAGLESWPPDGKYPNPYEWCKQCGHTGANHYERRFPGGSAAFTTCEVCEREGTVPQCTDYTPVDMLSRTHRPEQMPFWVLHPDSLAGGSVQWIPTNGTYPKELVNGEKDRT